MDDEIELSHLEVDGEDDTEVPRGTPKGRRKTHGRRWKISMDESMGKIMFFSCGKVLC